MQGSWDFFWKDGINGFLGLCHCLAATAKDPIS